MKNKSKFSWRKRALSFKYAWQGFLALVKTEHNSWIHLVVAACVIAAGIIWNVSLVEWCLLVLCIGSVIAAEAFNSAIEALADKISLENDELIGKAKDLGAFAVLFLSLASVCVGLIIFIPKIFDLNS